MTDRFHLNKFLQPASFNILQFYCLPCIFPPWTHTSKHTLKNSVCTHNLSYHQIINLFTCCWTQIWTVIWNLKIWVSRVLCGTFLGLMVIWGITYLLDAHSSWTVSEKSFWCWGSISNNEETSAPAKSHNMWGKERRRKVKYKAMLAEERLSLNLNSAE